MIVNEGVNRYPQIVEITRNDTGETIYKSGAIPSAAKSKSQAQCRPRRRYLRMYRTFL